MNCPPISHSVVIADDARLAAQVSCVLARPGYYLPVIDGPRMFRPDRDAEVARRNNAVARVKPNAIFLTGLTDNSFNAVSTRFTGRLRSKIQRISNFDDVNRLTDNGIKTNSPLVWGRGRLGIGLLKAMRARSGIIFNDDPSPDEAVPSKATHLVVCEEGNDLAEVIAANYAYAMRAGLYLIPEISDEKTDELLERFYSVYEQQDSAPTKILEELNAQLRDLCGPLPVPPNGSITFVTGGLPFGFSVPEFPSTHLFKYPDLGIAIINGFAAEQPGTPGIGFTALIDPEPGAHEIAAAEKLLSARGAFVRTYFGPGASVRRVAELMELFPYDLLIIATHCGDIGGYRWTYEFTDSEGHNRVFVVDLAIGVARTDDENMLSVREFLRFVSLDGVDWYDPQKEAKVYVGKAVWDLLEKRKAGPNELKPSKRENIGRVIGSAALKMHDQNLIMMPKSLADEGTPIIINNACASWHRLAGNLMFGNARAYVGTLFPVVTTEAEDVIVRLIGKHFSKPLPAALWSAQRETYGSNVRRPYIMAGVFPQFLRAKRQDVVGRTISRLSAALAAWNASLERVDPDDGPRAKMIKETIAFYVQQLAHFREVANNSGPRVVLHGGRAHQRP